MTSLWSLSSPLGELLMSSRDGITLSGLWFRGQKFYARGLEEKTKAEYLPVFADVEAWLTRYFRGIDPGTVPQLAPSGTPFQKAVWTEMKEIPYGKTCSYGELAANLSARRTGMRVSPRAVGSAVARNPISVLLPCHRVLAADGSLHGYAGGIWRKAVLLALEQGIPFSDE